MQPMAQIYISITGLRLKAFWHYPRFMARALWDAHATEVGVARAAAE